MKISRYSKEIVKCIKNNFKYTSIHGLRSIFRSKTKIEVYFWIIIFIIGVVYCCILLNENVIEFNYQRVLRTIDTTAYPIFQVPFPAVTLCNFNFVYKPKIKKIEDILLKAGITNNVTSAFFKHLNLLKTPQYIDTSPYRKVQFVLESKGYTTLKLMQELAQPCSNLLKYCFFAGVEVNCSKIFKETKADMGLCCSFNYEVLSKAPNINSSKQSNIADKNYYTGSGPLLGLYVYLNEEKSHTVSSLYNNTGIYAYVHDKSEYPSETSFFSLIQPGRELAMKITPTVTESEEELRYYKVHSRQCLFNDEGSTFWSKQYRFQNCIQQCKMRTYAKLCNCVPYFYPNLGLFNACTLMDVNCLKKNEHIFGEITIEDNFNEGGDEDKTVCDCLPQCTYFSYTGKTEMVYYKNMTGIPEENSAIRVYFQNSWCMKYKTIRQLETNSFIAIIGGIFSLCLGGSILSLVELICSIIKSSIGSWNVVKEKKKAEAEIYPQLYWNEIYKPKRNLKNFAYLHHYDFVN